MESSLSITRSELLEAIGRYLGWNRDSGKWSKTQILDAEAIIDKGLRRFYQPPALPGEKVSHAWSFLNPLAELTTIVGHGDYQLSDDFGGLVGQITYSNSSIAPTPITLTSDERIRLLRQRDLTATILNGYPEWAAIVPIASDGDDGQRFMLMLWPEPSAAFVLTYRYSSNPFRLTGKKPFPLGGQPHAETLRASVLAAAELEINDEKGARALDFMELLRTSVAHDRRANGPHHFGYNGDRNATDMPQAVRSQYVTFEGVRY